MSPGRDPGPNPIPDPIRARRARIAAGVTIAKRIGYGLLAVAVMAFVVAAATDFPSALLTVTVVALVVACIILPVPIVLGYGVRAAEREDLDGGEDPEEQANPGGEEPPSPRQ